MSGLSFDTSIFDLVDAQIMRCIQLYPRVPFSQVGEMLGVAEQTVARRYRRLRRDGLIRVTLAVDPSAMGETVWLARIRCRPEASQGIATALAKRDDVSWVTINSAGWEVDFSLRSTSAAYADELLTRMLPKTAQVLDVTVVAFIHVFIGGAATDWPGLVDVIPADAAGALADSARRDVGRGPDGVPAISRDDRLLIEQLQMDGRTSISMLSRITGSPPGKIGRRLSALLASGVVYFDVDFAPAATGQWSSALWLTVEAQQLAAVGSALAAEPGIPFAAAITGAANVTATIITPDLSSLYTFVTERLADLDGITGYEISPRTRLVKQSGALVDGDRLAPPVLRPS
ncbi:transcriptional regulator, AsnC family [Williamsia sterculiae]|uniref:Transcriptional regulator, AsnC family n=2 Tax=Williamsia sterculiae TaxID=1344003 RepID=A0A1N7EYX0_9NOCA|nr:transcriptional regulator, AsnC family [Williamsia sterculiae]